MTEANSTYRRANPRQRSGLPYRKLERRRPFGRSVRTSCPPSSSDGKLAWPCCTQSPFWWCNSTRYSDRWSGCRRSNSRAWAWIDRRIRHSWLPSMEPVELAFGPRRCSARPRLTAPNLPSCRLSTSPVLGLEQGSCHWGERKGIISLFYLFAILGKINWNHKLSISTLGIFIKLLYVHNRVFVIHL